jgi:preprotein translocase subunit SecA
MEQTSGNPFGEPIRDASVFSALKALRQNIEITNASSRKDVLKFDAVLEERRQAIWSRRRTLMTACDPEEWRFSVQDLIEDLVDRIAEKINVDAEEEGESLHKAEVWRRVLESVERPASGSDEDENEDEELDLSMSRESVIDQITALYNARIGTPDDNALFDWERAVMLSIIDNFWPQYLNELEGVEQDVHLRAYAQTDPFVAFRTEAASMFGKLIHDIELLALRIWLSVKSYEEVKAAREARTKKDAVLFTMPKRASNFKKKKKPKDKGRTKKKIKARE